MRLKNESLLSPFYVFINDNFELSDNQLFKILNLKGYSLITENEERLKGKWTNKETLKKRYLFLTEDKKWKHLMDDWMYTLWFNKRIRKNLQELSKSFDVFCCSIGDWDDSFDFRYYVAGKEKRVYVVEDPKLNGGEIVKNLGSPLEIEKIALSKKDSHEKILTIASFLGINIKHNLDEIRRYGRMEYDNEKINFRKEKY